MLAFHQVHKAIAMGILRFIRINGKENPSDVLTKPLDHGVLYLVIKPFLFACGDTLQKMGLKEKEKHY
jgi:hypothetical protein